MKRGTAKKQLAR